MPPRSDLPPWLRNGARAGAPAPRRRAAGTVAFALVVFALPVVTLLFSSRDPREIPAMALVLAVMAPGIVPFGIDVLNQRFFYAQDDGRMVFFEQVVLSVVASGIALLALALCRAPAADSVVVFNEINYNPATNEDANEWIELHNQMAVDIDLSAWHLEDGINFDFAEGTIIPGGGYLVIASDPVATAAAGRVHGDE